MDRRGFLGWMGAVAATAKLAESAGARAPDEEPKPARPPPLPPIELVETYIAGQPFHGGEQLAAQLVPGDPLDLVREPGNRHDQRAVQVLHEGVLLGYVPRRENRTIAKLLDDGEPVRARVSETRHDARAWKRITIVLEIPRTPAARG